MMKTYTETYTRLTRTTTLSKLRLLIKAHGFMSKIYFPLEADSIYNRDSQDLVYGANPDIEERLLFNTIPKFKFESAMLMDTLYAPDADQYEIFTELLNIPEDSMITVNIDDVLWKFRCKNKMEFIGADKTPVYCKYTMVGIA